MVSQVVAAASLVIEQRKAYLVPVCSQPDMSNHDI